jgi:hypothetical protein
MQDGLPHEKKQRLEAVKAGGVEFILDNHRKTNEQP